MLTLNSIMGSRRKSFKLLITEDICKNAISVCQKRTEQRLAHYQQRTGKPHPQEASIRKRCEAKNNTCMQRVGTIMMAIPMHYTRRRSA